MKINIILFFLLVSYIFIPLKLFSQEETTESAKDSEEIQSEDNDNLGYRFSLSPTMGFTFFNSSSENDEKENFQWLTKLQANLSYEGTDYQFSSNLFLEYGQIHRHNEFPEKYMDNLLFTLTPSMTIIHTPAIRLFFETTAQTQIGKGMIDTRKTNFMDPLVLYQTLFVGQKQFLIKNTSTDNFEVTYGVGYAFQQTLTKDFKIDTTIANTNSSFESGLSAIFQIDLNKQFTDDLKFKFDFKAVALPKEIKLKNLDNSRATMLLITGFFYKSIGIEYNLNLIYDKNLSTKRFLEQSLLLSLSFDI